MQSLLFGPRPTWLVAQHDFFVMVESGHSMFQASHVLLIFIRPMDLLIPKTASFTPAGTGHVQPSEGRDRKEAQKKSPCVPYYTCR